MPSWTFLRSIRSQLLVSFLTIILIISCISIISFLFLGKAKKIRSFKEAIDKESKQIESMAVLKLRFLLDESFNYEFHKDGRNEILEQHELLLNNIQTNLKDIQSKHEITDFEIESQLQNVIYNIEKIEKIFEQLIESTKTRGFKDFGLVGEMRKNIHQLENKSKYLDLSEVLMLRRHEKDYLLRNDAEYVSKLNKLANELLNKFDDSETALQEKVLLESYLTSFNQLVQARDVIGQFGHVGLLERLNQKMIYLNKDLEALSNKAALKQELIVRNSERVYYSSVFLVIFFGIMLSFYLANKRSRALREFAAAVKKKEIDVYNPTLEIDMSKSSIELHNLYEAFNFLLTKVAEQVMTIEQKTRTLEEQNIELQKVNNELDRFVYSVSHDLRSPLATVLGLTQLSRNENDIVKLKEYNELKEKSVLKLDNFIRDIINLSKNSRQNLMIKSIDFDLLVDDVFENHRYYKNAERVLKIKNIKQEEKFYSDPNRISVILNNLISNAIRYSNKFNEKPYVEVDVRVKGEKAIITVKDNGTGIGDEHLSKIFDMFYRATDENMGSGLGLYIANEALQKINGKIRVESKVGKGTAFIVTLSSLKRIKKMKGTGLIETMSDN